MLPKLIAHYLPQFHRIPENDAWWGEGFTEWTAVKAARPLFEGHRQPRKPLDDNYYDLSDIETLRWQSQLARQYGIYGFSFYHYWFKDGKQVLEKPAEMLLRDKSIDLKFCFNWANQTWARTWSKFVVDDQNVWAGTLEKKQHTNENNQGILLEQKYGEKEAWQKHIRYLIPFFQDERYIKINDRPVFILFLPQKIYCLSDMLECWNEELQKAGLKELYLIGESFGTEYVDVPELSAWLMRSPNYSMSSEGVKHMGSLVCYDYDKMWAKLLAHKQNKYFEKKTYLCAILDYDSTPRKGEKGEVVLGVDSIKFRRYFESLVKKHEGMNNELLFINAWNEWGEGMYLEPDQEHGYAYLEAIRDVMAACVEQSISKSADTECKFGAETDEVLRLQRRLKYVNSERGLLSRWLNISDDGNRLAKYFVDRGYKNVAVYGLGLPGKTLVKKLYGKNISVKYAIDRNPHIEYGDVRIYGLTDDWPEIDVVIVTPVGRYGEIKADIRRYHPGAVTVPLEHIIYELE